MKQEEILQHIENLPDDVVEHLARQTTFSVPWQHDTGEGAYKDPDGATSSLFRQDKDDSKHTRAILQARCWKKAQESPHSNTAIRGLAGRLAGRGFQVSCDIPEIQKEIEDTEDDPRNRLWLYYYKYALRAEVEGELFLCLTCHNNGFIETDFVDPVRIDGLSDSSGIIFHPTKTNMPLIYNIKSPEINDSGYTKVILDEQIPSIFIARYPDLLKVAAKSIDYNEALLKKSRSKAKKFSTTGGFRRFIISWDKGWITRRNIGHLRTILQWLEMYEDLKKWEADYKKSASSFVWNYQMEDMKAFRLWMSMSDEEREKTGIAAKKTPGATMISPPGFKLSAVYPNLPTLSDEDKDILRMISAGLGEPDHIMTGAAQGPFASVKASGGPFAERNEDERDSWEKFIRHDFWGSIFFLKHKIAGFRDKFSREICVGFKNQEPVFKKVSRRPETLLEINFPVSEVSELDKKARAMLGTKHAAITDALGIPHSAAAGRLGFGNYRQLRLEYETEKKIYPQLPLQLDPEAEQEAHQAEPSKETKEAEAKKKADISRAAK